MKSFCETATFKNNRLTIGERYSTIQKFYDPLPTEFSHMLRASLGSHLFVISFKGRVGDMPIWSPGIRCCFT